MEAIETLNVGGEAVGTQGVQVSEPHEDRIDARQRRLREFFAETERLLKDVPVKEVNESDPFIAKFKRMGILDVRP